MSQITLRNLPEIINQRIRQLSQESGLSLNKTIIELLGKSLGIRGNNPKQKRDVSKLAGTWSKKDENEFNKNTAVFNNIDQELWS